MTIAEARRQQRARPSGGSGLAEHLPVQAAATQSHGEEEDRLVQRCLSGDRDAFDSLVLGYRGRIEALARLALGNRDDAHDVAQETFVRAYEALPRYRRHGQFRVWIYTIAANLCRNRIKARRPDLSWHATDLSDSLVDPEPGPEAVALIGEQALLLREAVATLGARDRLIVLLYYQEDASVAEIAAIVGCRAGAVKVALHRARQRLRQQLEQTGFE